MPADVVRRVLFALLCFACTGSVAFAQGTSGGQARSQPARQRTAGPAEAPARNRQVASEPALPFELTAAEQKQLDAALAAWEQRSAGVETYRAGFNRLEYDDVFGPRDNKGQPKAKTVAEGEIKYAAPDKGLFKVEKLDEWSDTAKKYVTSELKEQWICDGKSIFEMNYQERQLIERKLPPELQGAAIAEGPLPFVFGASAERLSRRYFMRVTTPPEAKGQIWLEAYPRFHEDAANFLRAEIILGAKDYLPQAIRLHMPSGQNQTVFTFKGTKVNDPLGFLQRDFSKPKTPFGWTKVQEISPAAGQARRDEDAGRQE